MARDVPGATLPPAEFRDIRWGCRTRLPLRRPTAPPLTYRDIPLTIVPSLLRICFGDVGNCAPVVNCERCLLALPPHVTMVGITPQTVVPHRIA